MQLFQNRFWIFYFKPGLFTLIRTQPKAIMDDHFKDIPAQFIICCRYNLSRPNTMYWKSFTFRNKKKVLIFVFNKGDGLNFFSKSFLNLIQTYLWILFCKVVNSFVVDS